MQQLPRCFSCSYQCSEAFKFSFVIHKNHKNEDYCNYYTYIRLGLKRKRMKGNTRNRSGQSKWLT